MNVRIRMNAYACTHTSIRIYHKNGKVSNFRRVQAQGIHPDGWASAQVCRLIYLSEEGFEFLKLKFFSCGFHFLFLLFTYLGAYLIYEIKNGMI